jgi:hypothetical protein
MIIDSSDVIRHVNAANAIKANGDLTVEVEVNDSGIHLSSCHGNYAVRTCPRIISGDGNFLGTNNGAYELKASALKKIAFSLSRKEGVDIGIDKDSKVVSLNQFKLGFAVPERGVCGDIGEETSVAAWSAGTKELKANFAAHRDLVDGKNPSQSFLQVSVNGDIATSFLSSDTSVLAHSLIGDPKGMSPGANDSFSLPKQGLDFIGKFLDKNNSQTINLSLGKNALCLKGDSSSIQLPVGDKSYSGEIYEYLGDGNDAFHVEADKQRLGLAAKRMGIFGGKNRAIDFYLYDGQLAMYSLSEGLGESLDTFPVLGTDLKAKGLAYLFSVDLGQFAKFIDCHKGSDSMTITVSAPGEARVIKTAVPGISKIVSCCLDKKYVPDSPEYLRVLELLTGQNVATPVGNGHGAREEAPLAAPSRSGETAIGTRETLCTRDTALPTGNGPKPRDVALATGKPKKPQEITDDPDEFIVMATDNVYRETLDTKDPFKTLGLSARTASLIERCLKNGDNILNPKTTKRRISFKDINTIWRSKTYHVKGKHVFNIPVTVNGKKLFVSVCQESNGHIRKAFVKEARELAN